MTYTTVKSDLARRDARDTESDRCESTYTLRQSFGEHYQKGQTVRCTRPASGHRVHEYGSVQW